MSKGYTKDEILAKCAEALQEPSSFYKKEFVDYTGVCSDLRVPYTEIVAEFLCEHIEEYKAGFEVITREKSYYTGTHDGCYEESSNREEEKLAMDMYKYCQAGGKYGVIGKIIDYQTPLKDVQGDKAGKIDLLAYDDDDLILRILELKKPDSTETMLRCVLEGYTYLRTVDKNKLIEDFRKDAGVKMWENVRLVASPLVAKGGNQHSEYLKADSYLRKLMGKLGVEPVFFTIANGKIEIDG